VPLAGGGFAYVAFVIDAFAGTIRGWECSGSKATRFVQRAITQAAAGLRRAAGAALAGNVIHHSDAGSQYTSVRFAETLMLEGLAGSVGTVGDAYDNALAETTIGLYKSECVRGRFAVPGRPAADPGRRGEDHQLVGALVQHRPADAPDRAAAAGRGRRAVLGQPGLAHAAGGRRPERGRRA
jgi:transposase InsO family protein